MEHVPEDETVLAHAVYEVEKVAPFVCTWTDAAVYFSSIAFTTGQVSLNRTALGDVVRVRVARARPYFLWFCSAVLVAVGVATSILQFTQPDIDPSSNTYTVYGVPFGIAAIGLVLPFVAMRRYRIRVDTRSGRDLRWKTPLVMGSEPRAAGRRTVAAFLDGALKSGVRVEVAPEISDDLGRPPANA